MLSGQDRAAVVLGVFQSSDKDLSAFALWFRVEAVVFDPNDDRPLGAIPEEALEVIIAATEPDDGIKRERAEELLLEEGFGSPDAEWAIDRLLDRGYCYAVDDELFVTDREVLE